ncbi:MAG: hypothetical protein Q8876_01745 [Bacillota bacterium]|nr:hypothetical protein [Bacillota bacterium]
MCKAEEDGILSDSDENNTAQHKIDRKGRAVFRLIGYVDYYIKKKYILRAF